MIKKHWMAIGISMSFLMIACSNQENEPSEDSMAVPDQNSSVTMDSEIEEGAASVEQSELLIGEKVIKSVDVGYETTDFQESIDYIEKIIENHGAYIEYSNEWNDSADQQNRSLNYTLRVPTESLDTFLDELEEMNAYKESEMISSEDVTQSYHDTEARINVLNNKEERLNTLLEEAESVEAIIQIEDSLSETIAERESLQSIIENYDSLIDYTMVNVTLTERSTIANNGGGGRPFLERIQEAFINSAYAFFYFLQNVVIWVIYAIPFVLIIGIIVWIVYILKNKTQKKR
ncbi:DUF4349 domain-containing protein [Marinilactibacillus psychrotolerans]|uniref:DUF4349 domain-containing protein n=1 Tax=Marinilactibacillus psychrotolerans TaxID=191770 RepID=UPI003889C62F